MQYAIELYYDEELEKKLYALAQRVADEGISTFFLEWKSRPHLTLACFSDVDEQLAAERLKAYAACHKATPAHIGSVGMFPDSKVVFVEPIMHKGMYQLQRELHECMAGFDTQGWEWYLPDRWVPHCAMAMCRNDGQEAFLRASSLILNEFEKLNGMFTRVGLVKVSFPVQELCTFELAK